MKQVLRIIGVLFAILLAAVFGYGAWKNPENAELDAAARATAPGLFVGSSMGTTHYEVGGPDSGRTAVLVHGFSVPMYIWDSTFRALTDAGYRTIRYDLFGRGWSDRPNAAYDSALYVGQLDELLDSLRVAGRVDLIGLSFGGFVTGQFVASRPARVRSWTLVDPVASSARLPRLLTTPLIGPWIFQTQVVPGMADGQLSDFLHPERFPTWVEQYRPQMRFRGFGRSLLRTRVVTSRSDIDSLYARAGRTKVPSLLIWGRQDQTVSIELAENVRRAVPQMEYFPVDSAGHLPHIEQSALVNARLLAFLAAQATPATQLPRAP